MMTRTQITLDPEIHRRATQRASQLRISLSAYVRRLLARDLDQPKSSTDPSKVFNLGRSRGSDIARNRDAMLAEAFQPSGKRPSK